MGRVVTADTVGRDTDGQFVHKFWFGVQGSDVDPFLEAYEVNLMQAQLGVDDEEHIRESVEELKTEFKELFGKPYEDLYKEIEGGYKISDEPPRDQMQAAATINLGENLLKTIENMKAQDIEYQTLDIEL